MLRFPAKVFSVNNDGRKEPKERTGTDPQEAQMKSRKQLLVNQKGPTAEFTIETVDAQEQVRKRLKRSFNTIAQFNTFADLHGGDRLSGGHKHPRP